MTRLARLAPAFVLVLAPAAVRAQFPNIDVGRVGIDGRPISERIGDGRQGIRIGPRPTGSYSTTPSNVPPQINPETGQILQGSSSGGGPGAPDQRYRATLVQRPDGWYWEAAYRNSNGTARSPVMASPRIQQQKAAEQQLIARQQQAARQEQERAAAAMNLYIDDRGGAYSGGNFLGQAKRVTNKNSGRQAWRFDIPNGYTLIRYDGSKETTRHLYK